MTPLVIRVAWAVGYLDHPEARKLHTSATPLLGGAGVFACALAVWGAAMFVMPHEPAAWEGYYLLGGAGVALAVGLWDDRFGMRPSVKMLGQAVAAVILVAGGAVPDFGLPVGIEAAVTLVVNFLDNMNGMVGGLASLALVGFGWTSMVRGANGVAAAQFALAGACVGFLPHNYPKARIFLGDAGSLFLGYALGASALLAINHASPGWGRIGPLLVLAYPALDMAFVVVTRLQDHTNHRLSQIAGGAVRTVPIVWLLGAALCASGVVLLQLDRPMPTLVVAGLWVLVLVATGLRLAAVPVVRRG
jgi:UDP-GlcNAc:undecaprenyl-phosphate GlcNAc-1-phosphate transferase